MAEYVLGATNVVGFNTFNRIVSAGWLYICCSPRDCSDKTVPGRFHWCDGVLFMCTDMSRLAATFKIRHTRPDPKTFSTNDKPALPYDSIVINSATRCLLFSGLLFFFFLNQIQSVLFNRLQTISRVKIIVIRIYFRPTTN